MNSGGTSFIATLEALFARADFAAIAAAADANPGLALADPKSAYIAGAAFATLGNLARAVTLLEKAHESAPRDAAAAGALARVHILRGDEAAAEKLAETLGVLGKTDPAAADQFIETRLQSGRADEAYAAARDASKRHAHPHFLIRIAEAAIRTRRFAEGVDAARRAESALGLSPAVLNIAGPAAALSGDRVWRAR